MCLNNNIFGKNDLFKIFSVGFNLSAKYTLKLIRIHPKGLMKLISAARDYKGVLFNLFITEKDWYTFRVSAVILSNPYKSVTVIQNHQSRNILFFYIFYLDFFIVLYKIRIKRKYVQNCLFKTNILTFNLLSRKSFYCLKFILD